MSEYSSVYVNPLSITYFADRKEIVVKGFDKMETLSESDIADNHLSDGDIMFYDGDGDVIGFIAINKYFQ